VLLSTCCCRSRLGCRLFLLCCRLLLQAPLPQRLLLSLPGPEDRNAHSTQRYSLHVAAHHGTGSLPWFMRCAGAKAAVRSDMGVHQSCTRSCPAAVCMQSGTG
jgi:hypothetical protein